MGFKGLNNNRSSKAIYSFRIIVEAISEDKLDLFCCETFSLSLVEKPINIRLSSFVSYRIIVWRLITIHACILRMQTKYVVIKEIM